MIALKKLVLSKFHAGRVRLSENLLESIVLYCTVELLQTVHAHARILSVHVFLAELSTAARLLL